MFCKKPLGSNEVVEAFPVGRRLAFDPAKGRLWVVCRNCERWNLTPLEERWEAVETCEGLFRATRIRTSTENIGLARHAEGLELVRIGEPLRPEFAAWRYGDQFHRRRSRWIAAGSAGFAANIATSLTIQAATGGLIGGAGAAALGGGVAGLALVTVQRLLNRQANSAQFRRTDGTRCKLTREQVTQFTRIRADDDEPGFRIEIHKGSLSKKGPDLFVGDDAARAINAVLPLVNGAGAVTHHIREAVSQIESHGDPHRFIVDAAGREAATTGRGFPTLGRRWKAWLSGPGFVRTMSKPTRLALEMALNEEQERRALEGELAQLEAAWREAEEIAAIADNLFLPEHTDEFLDRHKRRGGSGGAF
ncbi:MAG: hypothetical protein OXK77_03470 [Gemmatimonadota bacterium]|nr:hypothetical protein [Gemmatimonadota bacterium]MDE2864519.1 hypothetical protein [Gemmatimonadota bacterium]